MRWRTEVARGASETAPRLERKYVTELTDQSTKDTRLNRSSQKPAKTLVSALTTTGRFTTHCKKDPTEREGVWAYFPTRMVR